MCNNILSYIFHLVRKGVGVMSEEVRNEEKKKQSCYFWKIYKYYVPVEQITLKGWVTWCNELYKIRHGHTRPGRIFIDPNMKRAMVKGRIWDREKIEKWLTDHGYSWTCTVETKYQYDYTNVENCVLIDADEDFLNKKEA